MASHPTPVRCNLGADAPRSAHHRRFREGMSRFSSSRNSTACRWAICHRAKGEDHEPCGVTRVSGERPPKVGTLPGSRSVSLRLPRAEERRPRSPAGRMAAAIPGRAGRAEARAGAPAPAQVRAREGRFVDVHRRHPGLPLRHDRRLRPGPHVCAAGRFQPEPLLQWFELHIRPRHLSHRRGLQRNVRGGVVQTGHNDPRRVGGQ
jgi:hypothetical protein